MPKISDIKKEKISEHVLSVLLDKYPEPIFTAHIAQEIARDEEFVKILMNDLLTKELVIKVDKNPEGIVLFHTASKSYFKTTLEKDEEYKGKGK